MIFAVFHRLWVLALLLGFLVAPIEGAFGQAAEWTGTWGTSPRQEPAAANKGPRAGMTVRQVVRVSIGGGEIRVRFTNVFGATSLKLDAAHIALAGKEGAIEPGSNRPLRFNGRESISVPAGATLLSDPVEFDLPPLAEVALTFRVVEVPATLTMHHGSRTTSYLHRDASPSAAVLSEAETVVSWYFLGGIDVRSEVPSAALVILGDSITDGYGTTTDRNNRWTDVLAQRLQGNGDTSRIAVLNQGIGGNRLLRDGLGPNMLARFDRDVLVQPGVRWVLVQAGINDIGTRLDARKRGEEYASAADIIAAFAQLADRAHARGVRIIGTTIMPYAGADFYWSADGEADRLIVNEWIRTSGRFDAVVDFDAALRDPAAPSRLHSAFDSGDHLHPSLAGYVEMARVVDLNLFSPPVVRRPVFHDER